MSDQCKCCSDMTLRTLVPKAKLKVKLKANPTPVPVPDKLVPPTTKSTIFPMSGYIVSFGATPHNLSEGIAIQDFVGPDGVVLDLRNLKGKPDKIPGGFQMNWTSKYINYPITDMNIPESMYRLKQTLDQVLQHPRIYIHCRGGHGRAGLVVAALCLQAQDCTTPQQALTRVHEAHQERKEMTDRFRKMGSPQRLSQKQFVRDYASYLKEPGPKPQQESENKIMELRSELKVI